MERKVNAVGAIIIILLVTTGLGFGIYKYVSSKLEDNSTASNNDNNQASETKINDSVQDKKQTVNNVVGSYIFTKEITQEDGPSGTWKYELLLKDDGQYFAGYSNMIVGSAARGTYSVKGNKVILNNIREYGSDGCYEKVNNNIEIEINSDGSLKDTSRIDKDLGILEVVLTKTDSTKLEIISNYQNNFSNEEYECK